MKLSLSLEQFEQRMGEKGWVIFPDAVDRALVDAMRDDLARAWDICSELQRTNLNSTDAELTVHHLIGIGNSFLDYIRHSDKLDPYFESYFKGKYILNSFGGAVNTKNKTSYAQRIHRDIRSYSGDMPLMLNTLVMLDDFTENNGATYLMTGSHRMAELPVEQDFYAHSERAVASSGSILVFDSNLWHAGGDNQTDHPRRSVTPMYCKPFIKPQFDYPRVLGYDRGESFSDHVRQVIGYNARIPATLSEWYQPPERRMYKRDQG